MSQQTTLAKTLSLPQAIGLAITLVVGSGLLALPGLAYHESGGSAIYTWLMTAAVSVPFLIVFARLGSRLPGAGGVSGFIQSAFSRRASIPTEFLLIGTFVVAGPATLVTGGLYFATATGLGQTGVLLGAAGILMIATTLNYLGARISGRVQQIMATGLILLLVAIAVASLAFGTRAGTGIAPISEWAKGVPSIGLVFFAFVGWELMSFTTEEFHNPQRDFPIMIAVSFVIVVALYALIAVAVQLVLPVNDVQITSAPIAALLSVTFGQTSGQVIALIGLLMTLASFTSGTWAASRLVFSSAREGLLPKMLSVVEPKTQTPRNAVVVMAFGYIPLVLLYLAGIISLSLLFQLAGVSFFTLYGLSVIAFIKISTSPLGKLFGVLVLLLVLVVMYTFGAAMIFPVALLVAGALWVIVKVPKGQETPVLSS
jgi:amino acid efflux transporter